MASNKIIEENAISLIEKLTNSKLPENYRRLKLRNDLNISSLDLIVLATDLEEATGIEISLQDLITHYATSENPVIEDLTIGQVLEYLER